MALDGAEPTRLEWLSTDPRCTVALGTRLAALLLRPSDLVALVGPLGAGKTQLVRGLASGLGIDPGEVSSPTFVLMTEHQGRLVLVHVDAYRLDNVADLESAGWSEELLDGAVTVVEWADRIADSLPEDHLWIELEHRSETSRLLRFEGRGAWAARMPLVGDLLEEMGRVRPCPTCGAPVREDDPEFPFCTPRCRMADLNRWFRGEYRVSRPLDQNDEV